MKITVENIHICGRVPCDICGRGYAPGVFQVVKRVSDSPVMLSDADVDRIARRVVELLAEQRSRS